MRWLPERLGISEEKKRKESTRAQEVHPTTSRLARAETLAKAKKVVLEEEAPETKVEAKAKVKTKAKVTKK